MVVSIMTAIFDATVATAVTPTDEDDQLHTMENEKGGSTILRYSYFSSFH